MAVVSVTGPSPYDIHIGSNNLDAVAGHLADSGARRAGGPPGTVACRC